MEQARIRKSGQKYIFFTRVREYSHKRTTTVTMRNPKVLRAILESRSADIDDTVFQVLDAVVTLEQGEGDEAAETPALRIKEDTDGSRSATSWKLYNVMRVSYHDLIGFLLKESTILLTENTRIKVIMSLLNLIFEFVPKLTYTFNEQDAQILFSIWRLGSKEVTAEEVAAAHERYCGQAIDPERVERSLRFFHKLHVLRYLGDGVYQVRERMIYERN